MKKIKSYEGKEACHICEGKFCLDEDDENYKKYLLKITVITQENLEEMLLAFAI